MGCTGPPVLTLVIGIFVVYSSKQSIVPTRDIQWQLPFIVQLVVPVLGMVLSFTVPETPRYLLAKGKGDAALTALAKLRNLPDADPYVLGEYESSKDACDEEQLAVGGAGWLTLLKECFTVPNYFRRTRTVIIAYVLAQLSGANSITNYLPTILNLIGVTNSNTTLLYTAGYSIAKVGCLVIGALFFIDIVGRRKSYLIGVTVQMLCLCVSPTQSPLTAASISRCTYTNTSSSRTSRKLRPTRPSRPSTSTRSDGRSVSSRFRTSLARSSSRLGSWL